MSETYIGDGVYISTDGFHIILRADDNVIYLEDYVFQEMLDYIKRVQQPTDIDPELGW